MVNVDEAIDRIFSQLGPLVPAQAEVVPLARAPGRVLAVDVVPAAPLPAGPRAAMDGFAVDSGALAGQGGPPHRLTAARTVLAGEDAPLALRPGEAAFVATGAPLPPGADAVVARELAQWGPSKDGGEARNGRAEPGTAPPSPSAPPRGPHLAAPRLGSTVLLRRTPAPGENVMPPGELVAADRPALRAGDLLTPAAVGLLAAIGRPSVPARLRPRVVLIATGDELEAPGGPRGAATVPESNTAMLAAACREAGAEPVVAPAAPDRAGALRAAFAAAVRDGPSLVLSTGGVSVGPADLVPGAWRDLGAEELFWRVAIKPGKPFFAARLGRTAAIGLSGSPAACFTAFVVLVEPLLRHWAGLRRPFPPAQRAVLAEAVPGRADVVRLLWSAVDGSGAVHPARRGGAGTLTQVAAANALLVQPAGSGPLPAGSPVWVLRTDRIGEEGEADPRSVLAAAARPRAHPGSGADHDLPDVCAVGGLSGHGKTTLIERLTAALTAAGEPVATIKHHAHGTPLEAPGKDGFRHRAAGARLTVVAGPGGTLWSEDTEGEPPLEAWLPGVRGRAAERGCRWVLVEGYHAAALPRIEVIDADGAGTPRPGRGDGLFLIAASDPGRVSAPPGVQVVSRDDVGALVGALRARFGRDRRPPASAAPAGTSGRA